MKKTKFILTACFCMLLTTVISAQGAKSITPGWTETDRHYLLDSLIATRDSLLKETENLTEAQWNFKESPDRWSIKEVTEHIAIWELLLTHEVNRAIGAGPHPDWTVKPDSVYLNFILEEKPHVSVEYSRPLGLNAGENNVAWILKLRNQSIEYLKTAKENLRLYYLKDGRPNVHQVYIYIFGHCERHLRQIRKIKANPNYPKN